MDAELAEPVRLHAWQLARNPHYESGSLCREQTRPCPSQIPLVLAEPKVGRKRLSQAARSEASPQRLLPADGSGATAAPAQAEMLRTDCPIGISLSSTGEPVLWSAILRLPGVASIATG